MWSSLLFTSLCIFIFATFQVICRSTILCVCLYDVIKERDRLFLTVVANLLQKNVFIDSDNLTYNNKYSSEFLQIKIL